MFRLVVGVLTCDQVSYDDERTFALKIKYAEEKCLGGSKLIPQPQNGYFGLI